MVTEQVKSFLILPDVVSKNLSAASWRILLRKELGLHGTRR